MVNFSNRTLECGSLLPPSFGEACFAAAGPVEIIASKTRAIELSPAFAHVAPRDGRERLPITHPTRAEGPAVSSHARKGVGWVKDELEG